MSYKSSCVPFAYIENKRCFRDKLKQFVGTDFCFVSGKKEILSFFIISSTILGNIIDTWLLKLSKAFIIQNWENNLFKAKIGVKKVTFLQEWS